METLRSLTGNWYGSYAFDSSEQRQSVPFTLVLKQGWFGNFSGTVTDDPRLGMPGTGAIKGRLAFPRIEFTKQMPVCFVGTPDGRSVPLRQFLEEQGYSCDWAVPHSPIHYSGEFTAALQAQGKWMIHAGQIPLGNGQAINLPAASGTWTMRA